MAMGVGPAYVSLFVEAQVDAAVRLGMPPQMAVELATATIEGSAALLAARGFDTLALRRAVTSPGGTTARGFAALERAACGPRSTPRPRRRCTGADGELRRGASARGGARRHRPLRQHALHRLPDLHLRLRRDQHHVLGRDPRCRTRAGRTRSSSSCERSCEPYLRIFRRILPSIGPLDLSPMVAMIVLIVVWRIVVALIQG